MKPVDDVDNSVILFPAQAFPSFDAKHGGSNPPAAPQWYDAARHCCSCWGQPRASERSSMGKRFPPQTPDLFDHAS